MFNRKMARFAKVYHLGATAGLEAADKFGEDMLGLQKEKFAAQLAQAKKQNEVEDKNRDRQLYAKNAAQADKVNIQAQEAQASNTASIKIGNA